MQKFRFHSISWEQIDRISPNFIYAFISTRSSLELSHIIFRNFVPELWPLIYAKTLFLLKIQLKGITKCSSMEANILTPDLYPLTLGLGSKGQNSTFLEHGHVAYQIKGNPKMQQYGIKYFVRRPSYLTSEVGVIKLRMQKRGSKNFACRPLPTPTPWPWGSGQKIKI